MKFTLEIELGNEAMQTYSDVEWSIRTAMRSLSDATEPLDAGESGKLWDANGNKVGRWTVAAEVAAPEPEPVDEPCGDCFGEGWLKVAPDGHEAPKGFVYIERCDACEQFADDHAAAIAYANGKMVIEDARGYLAPAPGQKPPDTLVVNVTLSLLVELGFDEWPTQAKLTEAAQANFIEHPDLQNPQYLFTDGNGTLKLVDAHND